MNPRAQAARIVHHVVNNNRSLTTVLCSKSLLPTSENQALIQELSYGTLRFYYRLKPIAKKLLVSPLKQKHQDVFALLLVGLYQLIYTNIPKYAAVCETVSAAKSLKKTWAKGLLNKTLRRFLKEKDTLLAMTDNKLSSKYAHPLWLIEAIKNSWPHHWNSIIESNNSRPSMTLRVNSQQISRDNYLSLLKENKIAATILADLPNAIQLEKPVAVNLLPNFNDGFVYVQDFAGQYAAQLLDLKPGQCVLDACAAPGSKTTNILEIETNLKKLIAIDKDSNRIKRIKENIDRLKLSINHLNLITANATDTKKWWNGNLFDRILLDAPCSATGIIGRHPDIKILRKESDLVQHATEQTKLLNALWPLLKQNGLLLYSTCSILPIENESIIDTFLSEHNDAKALPINVADSLTLTHGRQLLPKINHHDGFYYALLHKRCEN